MKVLFVLLFSLMTFANQKVLSKRTVTLPVDISTAKLKWTSLGYGETFFVKVIVPELAGETIMNHRNVGEDGPCMFTYDTQHLEDVIGNNPGVEDIDFEITLTKFFSKGAQGQCRVSLQENINANIRGFKFTHTLSHQMPNRVGEDCF
ncbi:MULTISPECIES: hypothetical protein [unclassified Halobacteriovorax]|uniref:hypothetical protein n=1 Tax=unclassified Halobacteriovorax TaxID=2639665 RepID=UPI00399AACB2